MIFLIHTVKFLYHTINKFFDYPPAIFDGLPYSLPNGVPPIFFHQKDRKGCTLDYLDGLGQATLIVLTHS